MASTPTSMTWSDSDWEPEDCPVEGIGADWEASREKPRTPPPESEPEAIDLPGLPPTPDPKVWKQWFAEADTERKFLPRDKRRRPRPSIAWRTSAGVVAPDLRELFSVAFRRKD